MNKTLIETGAIWLEEGFIPHNLDLFRVLTETTPWDGRMRARRTASFGLPYNYSGITYPATPFPDDLLKLLPQLKVRLGYEPNNCLVNHYPDGNSSMGFHADSTAELEPGTGIAIVSLGAERVITFRKQEDKQMQEQYRLPSGSLLFMTPEMQQHWKHAILPDESAGARISLTFRRMKVG